MKSLIEYARFSFIDLLHYRCLKTDILQIQYFKNDRECEIYSFHCPKSAEIVATLNEFADTTLMNSARYQQLFDNVNVQKGRDTFEHEICGEFFYQEADFKIDEVGTEGITQVKKARRAKTSRREKRRKSPSVISSTSKEVENDICSAGIFFPEVEGGGIGLEFCLMSPSTKHESPFAPVEDGLSKRSMSDFIRKKHDIVKPSKICSDTIKCINRTSKKIIDLFDNDSMSEEDVMGDLPPEDFSENDEIFDLDSDFDFQPNKKKKAFSLNKTKFKR